MKKIESLQALRGICYIIVFLHHVGIESVPGGLAISIFFILSGFLTMYRSKYNDEELTFKKCFISAFSRIKKIYLLHVIATLFVALLDFYNLYLERASLSSYTTLLLNIFFNITLTKTLVPSININTSLNGASWFLASIFIIYLLSPYFIRLVNKHSKKSLVVTCIALICLQIVACIPMNYFFGIESGTSIWFMYFFPLFRMVDYFCGLVVGKCYQDILNINVNGFCKALILILLIAASYALIFIYDPFGSIYLNAVLNWSSKFIPFAILWIVVFIRNDTIFTKILNNQFLRSLGDLNMYLFLIHNVVIICFNFLELNMHIGNFDLSIVGIFIVSLLLGIACKLISKITSMQKTI